MKLRIQGNSLRLRLRRSEVRQLADGGRVEERTAFGPAAAAALVYALLADDVTHVTASFEEGRLDVRVPHAVAAAWAGGDQIGIEASQPAGGGELLRILIEKDFECIDAPPGESQDDAFPNPRGNNC